MDTNQRDALGFAQGRKWKARWIWEPGDPKAPNAYCYFRKEFNLEELSSICRVFVAADTRFQLFINGRFVERGGPQSQPFLQYYDEHEVSEHLKRGLNCIAVIANHTGILPDTQGGLLAEVVSDDGQVIAATGEDWRAARAVAWTSDTYAYRGNKTTPFQEFYDARKAPEGWNLPGFDDSRWDKPFVVSTWISDRPPAVSPWTKLVPRDIPYMTAVPVLPDRIERVEESLDLINRSRANDLAPGLSMVGTEIKYSAVTGAENLCRESGDTTVQCSRNHLDDLDFDGVYAPAIVLDFGRVITARARIELSGMAGGMVEFGYAERLIDGHFNIAMECEFTDRYTMKNGEQSWESFSWRAFRYLKVRFRSCFEPITVRSIKGIISTYPYAERGCFDSTDKILNKVFEISRDTVRLCSNDCLMDTPWREQAQWLGDVAAVTVPCIYACFGDDLLPGKFIRQSAHNQHPTGMLSNISNIVNHNWQSAIPDYSLWWVMGLWNHYLYTGDEHWIHSFYPNALRIIYSHLDYVNEHGLIEDMPYWVFIDWADVERRGESAAYNGIFYGALETLAKMARLKNDRFTLELADEAMASIKSNFQAHLFDSDRRCFADANIDGRLSEKVSEHGNAAAIMWGLCDEETSRQAIETLWEKRSLRATEAQPFFMVVVLNALDRAGRFDLALRLIHDRWGRRMVERGATSVSEEWYINGSWRAGDWTGFLRTLSHAWSAIPAEFLIRNMMGLKIITPGGSKVSVSPKDVPFDYTVKYPVPAGVITVRKHGSEVEVSNTDTIKVQLA